MIREVSRFNFAALLIKVIFSLTTPLIRGIFNLAAMPLIRGIFNLAALLIKGIFSLAEPPVKSLLAYLVTSLTAYLRSII